MGGPDWGKPWSDGLAHQEWPVLDRHGRDLGDDPEGPGSGDVGNADRPGRSSSTPSTTERHNVFTRHPACTAPFPANDLPKLKALRDQVQLAIDAILSRRHGAQAKRRLAALEDRRTKINAEIRSLTVPEEKAS